MAQNNARIIETDIFSSVAATAAGSSPTIDLFGSSGGANRFSIQAIYDVSAPSAKNFSSGRFEVDTATFQAKASMAAGDYLVIYDTLNEPWAIAANISGADPEPTGSVWQGVNPARRAQVDLSSAVIITAADVSVAFQNAFNALTSVPFVASTPPSANCTFTQNIRSPIEAPSSHNANDSGSGSIAVVVTTPGISPEVFPTTDTIYVPTHGYSNGFKIRLTTTGTLPAPFMTATDYFVIVVDEDTIQLASSLSNAFAETPIDITNQGSNGATNTITGVALAGASVTFQCSNDGTNWADIQAATAITVDGSTFLNQPNVSYRYFKAVKALTSGQVDLQGLILVIGDSI